MKEFTIAAADDGRKLDKWLAREMPAVGMGQRQKFYRQKKVQVQRPPPRSADARLAAGDVLQIYLNDELFVRPQREDPFLSKIQPRLNVLYEDANLLIVDKQPGLPVHPDAHEKVNTLVAHVQAYLYQKGEYVPGGFAPALCNRIDRFTGGIVTAAKTQAAMRIINQKIRDREIRKLYLCVALWVHSGSAEGLLDNYIIKEEGRKKVRVSTCMEPGAQRAQTKYRVLAAQRRAAARRVRAADRPHPSDPRAAGACGASAAGRRPVRRRAAQPQIWTRFSSALRLPPDLRFFDRRRVYSDPLKGLEIAVPQVRFVREYFPEYRL